MVYEYRCLSCNQEFEYQQRMADPAKTVCEACSGALERIISRTSFHLKGGGWYKDLYASTKPEGAASGSDGGTPASTTTPTPAAPASSTPTPASSTPAPASSTPAPSSSSSTGSSSSGGGSSGGGSTSSAGSST